MCETWLLCNNCTTVQIFKCKKHFTSVAHGVGHAPQRLVLQLGHRDGRGRGRWGWWGTEGFSNQKMWMCETEHHKHTVILWIILKTNKQPREERPSREMMVMWWAALWKYSKMWQCFWESGRLRKKVFLFYKMAFQTKPSSSFQHFSTFDFYENKK